VCTSCNLALRDTYGDNWSGNYFTGFGINATVTDSDNNGRSKSIDFTSPGCAAVNTSDVSDNRTAPAENVTRPVVDNTTGFVRSNVTVNGGSY
jgi:hypothetical protein